MKSIIIDTSSAILLFKSKLIAHLVNHYNTLITLSVYRELTKHGYPGSFEIQQLCEEKQIQVLALKRPVLNGQGSYPTLPTLNSGEKDTIRHQMQGIGDFIMIDDGRAAKYCKKAGLPFINALLFPRILFLIQAISESEYDQKRAEILCYGRYADSVIEMALNLSDQAIKPFLPTQ